MTAEATPQASLEQRFAGIESTTDEPDTQQGTPGEAEDLEAGDGPLATTETDEEESDTDDGTPDDDEAAEGGFEKRFKDTQAELTEKSQALAKTVEEFESFKAEYAKQIDGITQAEQQVQDRLAESEQLARHLLGPVQARLQQLGQMNAQQMSQEEYSKWQQEVSALQGQAGHFGRLAEQAKQRLSEVRKHSDERQMAHANKVLSVLIPDFNEVKGNLVDHAKSLGWPESTIYSVKDPHILKLLKDSYDLSHAS